MTNLQPEDFVLITQLIDERIELKLREIKQEKNYLKIAGEQAEANGAHFSKLLRANYFLNDYAHQFEEKMDKAVSELIDTFVTKQLKITLRENLAKALENVADKVFHALRDNL